MREPAAPSAANPPRLAMAAPIRQEAAYLLEWIAYHRSIGIDTIILGDNGGDDGTSQLLERLARAGIVHRLDFLGRKFFQHEFNEAALALAHGLADGLIFIDADEFVRIDDPVQNGFDAAWYLDAYPDVRASGMVPLEHFHAAGWREKRNPNEVFNTRFYLDSNPDVALAGIDPLRHFEETGWREGRDPGPDFSTARYRLEHSGIAAGVCPLDHYLESNAYQGRSRAGLSLRELASDWFADPDFGAIGFNWAIFGSNGEVGVRDGLVLERFASRAPRNYIVNHHVKTMVRVEACDAMIQMHAAHMKWNRRKPWRGRYNYLASDGAPIDWQSVPASFLRKRIVPGVCNQVVWGAARIEHFCVKSRMEFEIKRGRGAANSQFCETARFADEYWTQHNRNDFYDPMPAARIAATKREIARIEAALAAAP